ncbi:calcium/sodium antiporter [Aliiglaciecola sp. 3_MG-2023]|uniref:calcium/sodium antiporter n=1 Tax=Aliiglaciecola sp. 3_MG-2023 TaxID=3062644 RepID=UPI0026E3F08B|nr:calcium/sodium antiporter [Aliiglaciecola sp. 3_MG-2023]MDO6695105.1 calcium/sodium antiporter [Aliiglaciecola sp. 3_MG-2023]
MILEFLIFIAGLAALSWSADKFVYGASALATNIGVSPMIIGLTIVAMGSSAPEIVVSATASLSNNPDTAVGNAIGSNITNIALVLGITAILKPLMVSSSTIRRELPVLLAVTLLAVYFLADGHLSVIEGVILIVLFFLTIGGLTWISLSAEKNDPLHTETADEVPRGVPASKAIFWVILGLIFLPLSAHFMVDSAVHIARYMGMSELVIGLTIIALGTSLPELAACIAGVLKGEDDLVLGNIIGSNIFNILAVLAMPGLLAPGIIDANVAQRDMYAMLIVTVLLIIFSFNIRGKRQINRWEGIALVGCYLAYCAFLFF